MKDTGPYRHVLVEPERAPNYWCIAGPAALPTDLTWSDEDDAGNVCDSLNAAYRAGAEAMRERCGDMEVVGLLDEIVKICKGPAPVDRAYEYGIAQFRKAIRALPLRGGEGAR